MPSGIPSHPAFADPPAADPWRGVSDELIRGLTHALNNRFAAISSIARLVVDDGAGASPLLAALPKEIDHLERTLRLLRWLPSSPEGPAEPVRLDDLLPELLDLHRLSSVALDLELVLRTDGNTLPLRAEPVQLAHALLLLLDMASRQALARGNAAVEIRLSGDDEVVTVVLDSSSVTGTDRSAPASIREEAQFVRGFLETAGGSLVEGEALRASGSGQITLRLPTLLAARRREER